MKEQIVTEFRQRYNQDPDALFFCPGRINLIGEHIDYNGGRVMPCAIELGTYLAVATAPDGQFNLQSINFPETLSGKQLPTEKTGSEWFNYPLGVIRELGQQHPVPPLRMLFGGNLPIGSSLSSSASIEVLTAFALSRLLGSDISRISLALLAKNVENNFVGVNCGIMDQFAVAMGRANEALLLNCDTLDYEYRPLQLASFQLAVINTNKPRKLVESKYNERFAECRLALKQLQEVISIQHLCDLTPETFALHAARISDGVVQKRARHVVEENDRVNQAADFLAAGNLEAFGRLMYASHASLRNLYEVSGIELDTIVEFATAFEGCIGARMTGAGFGGCAIALVETNRMPAFAREITDYYQSRIGYPPAVFASLASEGVRQLEQ